MTPKGDRIELAALWLAIFAQTASFSVYSPLVPLLKSDLGFSYGDFGLLATAFYIPYTALQVVSGSVAGRGKVRSMMLPALAVILVSTALLGAVGNLPEALLLRFVTGAAAAMIFVPSMMVIARRYRGRTNTALGAYGTGVAAGALYISLLAPAVASWLGWRLAMPALMLPVVFVWTVTYVGVRNFSPPTSGEAHQRSRLWSRVLKNRITWLLGYQQLVRVGMWAAILTFLPTFFSAGLGYSTFASSAALMLFAVLAAFSSVLGSRMVGRVNSNAKVTLLSMSIMCVGLVLIGLAPAGVAPWLLAAALGLGAIMAFGPQFTMAAELFGAETLGLAVGVQAVLGNVGATVLPYIFGSLRDFTGGFEASWELSGLLCAAAALTGVALLQTEVHRHLSMSSTDQTPIPA